MMLQKSLPVMSDTKKERPTINVLRICSAIMWYMVYFQSGSVKPINPDRFSVCLFFKWQAKPL